MWNNITQVPDDPIFGLNTLFTQDPRPEKVNLGIGAYKDGGGQPVVLETVKKAESLLLNEHLNKEYPPMEGIPRFIQASAKLIFGADNPALAEGKIVTIQTLGGTGGLRIGAELIAEKCTKKVFFSAPTWPNHAQIFHFAGFSTGSYSYYDSKTHGLDFSGMKDSIVNIPKGSVIVLHACCHNPSGVDPSLQEWKELSSLIKKQGLLPFFDLAYQGFAKDLISDTAAIRLFISDGHDLLVSCSHSKNFGLYGERVGSLSVVSQNAENAPKIKSYLKQLVRSSYSMPPLHGARIATTILESDVLKKEWEKELQQMRQRIVDMRKALVNGLHQMKTPINFDFINRQSGMFSFSGLSEKQVLLLREKYGIYTPTSGRINVAGLNEHNIHYVVQSISKVINADETKTN